MEDLLQFLSIVGAMFIGASLYQIITSISTGTCVCVCACARMCMNICIMYMNAHVCLKCVHIVHARVGFIRVRVHL